MQDGKNRISLIYKAWMAGYILIGAVLILIEDLVFHDGYLPFGLVITLYIVGYVIVTSLGRSKGWLK